MVDRRRLRDGDTYIPTGARGAAIAKQRAAAYRFNNKVEPFRTERSPGTGGFGTGLQTQIMRNQKIGEENERAEAFRTLQ